MSGAGRDGRGRFKGRGAAIPRSKVALAALTAAAAFGAIDAAPAASGKVAEALALVPGDAIAAVVVPNPKAASDDLAQCIERMERPAVALLGRPIDAIKAQLGVAVGVEDAAPVVMWLPPPASDGATPQLLLSVGSSDPASFLSANFEAAPDVAPDAWRRDGEVLFARTDGARVVVGSDAEAVRRWKPGEGFGERLRERMGDRAVELMQQAECSVWVGSDALAMMRAQAVAAAKREAGADAGEVEAFPLLGDAVRDVLVVFDVDPLGLSVRSLTAFGEENASGDESVAGVVGGGRGDARSGDGSGERAVTDRRGAGDPSRAAGDEAFVSRLPGDVSSLMLAVAIDGRAFRSIGGASALREFASLAGGEHLLPPWLEECEALIDGVQLGLYRSKLGIASGAFNDSALFLRTRDPERVRALVRAWVESMAGRDPLTGDIRTPVWEESRTLRSGETVSAFEVTESIDPDAPLARDAMMRRVAKQFIVGPRGLRGFVRPAADGVVVTLSQRSDVLGRAIEAAEGKSTLAANGVIRALRRWLLPRPDVEVFLGVGAILRIEQVSAFLLGPRRDGAPLPDRIEPVAFAASLGDGTLETATMIPTGVLAIVVDRVAGSRLRAVAAPVAGE